MVPPRWRWLLAFVTFNQKQRRTRDRFKPLNLSSLKSALSYLSSLISFLYVNYNQSTINASACHSYLSGQCMERFRFWKCPASPCMFILCGYSIEIPGSADCGHELYGCGSVPRAKLKSGRTCGPIPHFLGTIFINYPGPIFIPAGGGVCSMESHKTGRRRISLEGNRTKSELGSFAN